MTSTANRGGYRQINKTLNICVFENYLDIQQSRLPHLNDVEQLGPRVIRVLGQNRGKSALVRRGSLSIPAKGFRNGQRFSVEGATIRAVHSPGHSHDHMCFILEEENAMFTGDNVLGHGTSAVELLSLWMSSLRKMQSHNCAVGYPAHGEVITDLPAKINGELAQKARRERQVLQTLSRIKREERSAGRGKGSVTVKQLVTAMHGDELDSEVRELALEPFIDEVLRKLAEEDKVAFELRRGEKRWFGVDFT
ncbi:Metallo-hydrolase/oxidoreductase [Mollisia scopiformis]|uniref:Metallo-hydrolase/oxidoreductase n=1 Tax=Mollisia scopiformis TaxID=149040 RepID=A0A194X0W1_MOLSC|nr:Metallo-hydrolase/oxidoreductase [Mollisia scopiformis]KUJ13604.1 Metallo-hydrolase/oxidoreductase [Mollisia scopiformis]